MMDKICGNCFQETLNDRGVCLVCGFDGAANREAFPMALPSGSILYGRYIVGKVLGQGGFGITYAARDYQTGETVAIKEFFPDAMATRTAVATVRPFAGERGENFVYGRDVFLEEARTLAEFHGHPNIVQVHVYFEENNTGYFVMEYVSGTSLRHYIADRGGRLSWQEASELLLPVMDALSAVHEKGIIHRDIAPDNIYISENGTVKLLDFGASRYSLGNVSHSLDVILKPGYTPKEQYRRRSRQGPYTDVYSLGATFYHAITGAKPDEALDRDEEDNLPYPSSLGAKVTAPQEEVLLKAMAVEPDDRYQTMAQFRTAVTDPPPVPKPEPPVKPVEPEKKEKPEKTEQKRNTDPVSRKLPKWLLPAGAAAVLAIGILIGTAGGSDKPAEPTDPPAMAVQTEPEQTVRETVEPTKLTEETVPPTEPFEMKITMITDANGVPLNALMEDKYREERTLEDLMEEQAFGTQALRREVASITFLDTTAAAPEMAADASQLGNGNVKAWAVKRKNLDLQTKQGGDGSTEPALEFVSSDLYDLYIAADGGVYAPINSNFLFASMPNLTSISFGDAFHTEYAQKMAQMFSQDRLLTALDLSGFDTSGVTNMHCMFQSCEALTELDLSSFETGSVEHFSYVFSGCRNLMSLNLSSFDTGSATTMQKMFRDCENLVSLDVSGFDTSNVVDMNNMFYGCAKLETLDVSGFDTAKVTNLNAMFNGCAAVRELDVGGFVTSQCTDIAYMFNGCHSLEKLDVSGFDTSSAVTMNTMFQNCGSLTKLDVSGFVTDQCTNMSYMFMECTKLDYLDVSRFNTSNVTTMKCMFANCRTLNDLDVSSFKTSSVTDMTALFQNCESLTELDVSGFNTAKVAAMNHMFKGCKSLTALNISKFDTSKVTDMSYMFHECSSLKELNLAKFKSGKETVLTSMFAGCENLKTFKCSDSRIKKAYQER